MKISSLSAILLAASALAAPAITVSNVSISQNLTTRTVTVNYTLDTPAFVRCDILTNGASIGRAHLKTFSETIQRTPRRRTPPVPAPYIGVLSRIFQAS